MNSIEVDFMYGLVGTFLFIFRNPDKKGIYPVSLFTVGLFISQMAYFYLGTLSGQIIWAISGIGLLTCYAVRFTNKRQKGIIEFLKVLGVILLTIYPLPFYSLARVDDSNFWTVTRMLTFAVLMTIYLYDRWILKPEHMRKKYIVILVGQSILILLMLVFSFVQKAEADRSREVAEQHRIQAVESEKRAVEMKRKYDELVEENAR